MAKLATIPMSPMPEFGYDPIPLILSGEKVHTLRKRRCFGCKEITVRAKGRTGIVVEFYQQEKLLLSEYATEEFAHADGLRPTNHRSAKANLIRLLCFFYNAPSLYMYCNHFRVVERPEEGD